MIYSATKKRLNVSTSSYRDESKIKCEQHMIIFDNDKQINYITLSKEPKGDIISLIVSLDFEDINVDGVFNISSKRVEFLQNENFHLKNCEVKYLIDGANN